MLSAICRRQCLTLLATLGCLVIPEAAEEFKAKYCIIGAGPAGIQLGHYFQQSGLDYVTWERGETAATFFRAYPIHRKLISINRQNTRSSNPEFNLRHDWNSLLDFPIPLFTTRTDEYFPHADVLVQYLQEAADLQEGHIMYRHAVQVVRRREQVEAGSENGTFEVTVSAGSKTRVWQCTVVIGALGLWKANAPDDWVQGLQHTVGYEELTPWPGSSAFNGKSVLILGNGNAAFETADAVRNAASDIGIISRRQERLAHQTHYVGDVRAARTTSLDAVQLKSLDGVETIHSAEGRGIELLPCAAPGPGRGQGGNGWPQDFYDTELSGFQGRPPVCALAEHSAEEFILADHDPEHPAVQDVLARWPEHVNVRNASRAYADQFLEWANNHGGLAADAVPGVMEAIAGEATVLTVAKSAARQLAKESAEFRAALPRLMSTQQGLYEAHDKLRKPFDVVVRALGWKMEKLIFEPLNIRMDSLDKYPVIDACFKSQDGLYFAGTVTHGFDKYRFGSAGGFIHGFRYTSKSLFRCLMSRYEKWPTWKDARELFEWDMPSPETGTSPENLTCSAKLDMAVDCAALQGTGRRTLDARSSWNNVQALRRDLEQNPLWSKLLRRINEASGPYQMSCGALVDGIVYNKHKKEALYVADIPMLLFEKIWKHYPRLLFQYRYGTRHDINEGDVLRTRLVAFASHFLHPVLFYMQPGQSVSNSSRLHITEDRWTDFAGREEVIALHYFLSEIETASWSGRDPPSFHEKVDDIAMTCNHHA